MQRVKDWLIKKLGGYTRKEQAHYAAFYVGRNMYLNDAVVDHMRQAREWGKRAKEAEARVKEYEKLDMRLSRMVHLRAEVRETHEWMHRNQVSRQELTEYIRGKLAMQLADAILGNVGVVETEDRLRMEYAWTCEAYLLKREE